MPPWKQVRAIADAGGRGIIWGYRNGGQLWVSWTDRRGTRRFKVVA